jgi:hypothetical protein
MNNSNNNTNAAREAGRITSEDINALAKRANQLSATMDHGSACFAAVEEAIDFGWLKKADKYTALSLASNRLTEWLVNGHKL